MAKKKAKKKVSKKVKGKKIAGLMGTKKMSSEDDDC